LSFVESNATVKVFFRWIVKGKFKSQNITKKINGNYWPISVNELKTGQASNINKDDPKTNTSNPPGVGKVHFIEKAKAEIPEFKLTVKNNTSKGLIFMGEVFNGFALQPFDSVNSDELVRPGLIEINVLYQISDTNDNVFSGQATAFSQQALSYMIIDESQTIHIENEDLLNPASMTDQKIRFKNVSKVVLYPSSKNKKLTALRPREISKKIKIEDLKDLVWYYNDPKNDMRRVAIFEIILGRTPIIKIKPMPNVYGNAKSQ
jgi:hypothetical protein